MPETITSSAYQTETAVIAKKPAPKTPKPDSLKILLQSLKTFSKEDLITIRDRTESLIARRESAERKAALKQAREMMEKYGFTPEELAE